MSSRPGSAPLPTGRTVDQRFEGGTVARPKQTDRAEARRRYRQTAATPVTEEGTELDYGERRTDIGAGKPGSTSTGATPTRPGFGAAFRQAYHPPKLREDLQHLPMLLRSRAFLGAVALILAGAVAVLAFPNYTGSRFALELLIWPGSALAPQLVAGFFAPRASYLLGLIVGFIQGIVFSIFVTQFSTQTGIGLPADQLTNVFTVSFLSGPVTGSLFAAAAAWYRRFLALTSPRRAPAGRPVRGNTSRRPAGR
jgi:hypothetical protein